MNEHMQLIREVNNQAELFYKESVSLGNHAFAALGSDHRAQLTGLENIAESAFKTSDIFDYIKKQTARSREAEGWRRPESRNAPGFGDRLRSYLEVTLREKAANISQIVPAGAETSDEAKQQRQRRIHLLLIRQFLRQMVVQYEYQVMSFGARQGEQ
jgi:hypothetical protein